MKSLLLLTALFVAAGPSRASADDVSVVVGGRPQESADSYRAGELYLDAKRVGALYGGQVYWYPVSGRVSLTARGRALQLVVGSDKASSGERELRLEKPVIVRASRAFVPLSFLTSEGFAEWSGHRTTFDERTKTLVVERAGTVGEPRAFSYKGRTRVSVELAPDAPHRASARGTGAVDVVFDGGVAEGEGRVEVDDGVVASYALKQEARLARLSVNFAEKGQRWKLTELENPRRAVLDVYALGVEIPKDEPQTETTGESEKKPLPAVQPQGEKIVKTEILPKASTPAKTSKKRRLIVIDAGHGGKDPGATGTRGTREKDVNLAAALELSRVLKERGDFEVLLTRDEDVFLPLSERSEIANSRGADLFVSLHCNAAGNKRENGFEVYSVSETATDPEAEALAAKENSVLELEGKNAEDETAKMILLAMTKTEVLNESAALSALAAKAIAKRVDVEARGAKQAAFYVLRGTHAPGILVEMAFVSHAKDEAKLASRRFRRAMAEGVAAGIADYARRQGWLE
ncbi:MAG: N-acetylmuramoyl-L-alanine amidase [Elusimicrobiota bacterium]|nr:MAG: N-acetylmuramoyl-L-alanine amidase [Elusimicrobiota bacterium]